MVYINLCSFSRRALGSFQLPISYGGCGEGVRSREKEQKEEAWGALGGGHFIWVEVVGVRAGAGTQPFLVRDSLTSFVS